MQKVDDIKYTASGRLAVWDTLDNGRENFLTLLEKTLSPHSCGSLAIEGLDLIETENPGPAGLFAVLKKILTRGVPTLVDVDFEKALVSTCSAFKLSDYYYESNCRLIGYRLLKSQILSKELLNTTWELLNACPTEELAENVINKNVNNSEDRDSVSLEEDVFYQAFGNIFGQLAQARLKRQSLLSDLIGSEDPDFIASRVDFALRLPESSWVFEVDGSQHSEVSEAQLDKRRTIALQEAGWQVIRLSAVDACENAEAWIQNNWIKKLNKNDNDSLTNSSPTFARLDELRYITAYNSIVLPHLVHRCLMGLAHLVQFEVFPFERHNDPFRILVVEEDFPVVAEAMVQLKKLWSRLHTLNALFPEFPIIELDVIGDGLPYQDCWEDLIIRAIETPEGKYNLGISHSHFLSAGQRGSIQESAITSDCNLWLEMRGIHSERDLRDLPWSPPFRYQLEDLDVALRTKGTDDATSLPQAKLEALRFFLQTLFRKYDFWDGQARVISRLLSGKSSVVLLPTGGGKSLTYQFSGLLLPGMTIVIDPLIALMNDQVENLKSLGIDRVDFIASLKEAQAREESTQEMARNRLQFVFIAPERLQMEEFRNHLKAVANRITIPLAVIDEVHCVSEWGHDFRPSYLHLGRNISNYCSNGTESPTLVGLTGTASFAVLTDVQVELGITEEEAVVLPKSFDRKELIFSVINTPAREKEVSLRNLKQDLPRLFRKNPQHFFEAKGADTNCGLIFCPHVNGSIGVYHIAQILGHGQFFAGKKPKSWYNRSEEEWNAFKSEIQSKFKQNYIQELVSTKSFGMGIDKPNIRYTIHYGIPPSVEAFYQEVGRAGRDGKENSSHCFILYSDDNWNQSRAIIEENNHSIASNMLEKVHWDDRGDVIHQLWFLLNAYKDRDIEKRKTYLLWEKTLLPQVEGLGGGDANTVEVSFGRGDDRETNEKSIFRLAMLGAIRDYSVDWRRRQFKVNVLSIRPSQAKEHILEFLSRYKFREYAEQLTESISTSDVRVTMREAISIMIDFVYDEIATKRKQALSTMADLCRTFKSDSAFRDSILAYLQESEFSAILKEWVNKPYNEIGMKTIYEVLDKVTTLDEAKRLVGTSRRMLDEDPSSVALRYISACARIRSIAEGDESVQQECRALLRLLSKEENETDAPGLIMSLLEELSINRTRLLSKVLYDALRLAGSADLARIYLQKYNKWPEDNTVRKGLSFLLLAGAFNQVKSVIPELGELKQ